MAFLFIMIDKPIGVFDSGIGGITVLKELIAQLPNEDYIYIADSKNAPYGHLPKKEIISLSEKCVEILLEYNCKLIVIACNTATAAAVEYLRNKFTVPIVGLEPAVKPACLKTKTGNVGVLATKGTFRGNHFKQTSNKYQDYVNIHLQVAQGLVELAEKGDFQSETAENIVKYNLNKFIGKNIDYIVLGCTHYPYFIDLIKKFAEKNVRIIDSAIPVTIRTKDLLMTNKLLSNRIKQGQVKVLYSGNNKNAPTVVNKYLNVSKFIEFV